MVSEQTTLHIPQKKAEHCFKMAAGFARKPGMWCPNLHLPLDEMCHFLSPAFLCLPCTSSVALSWGMAPDLSLPHFPTSAITSSFLPLKRTSGLEKYSHHLSKPMVLVSSVSLGITLLLFKPQQNTSHETISGCVQETPGEMQVLNFNRIFVYLM